MDQFPRGSLTSPNDHWVVQAQPPYWLGNNCLSESVSPGTGSILVNPHHGLEECNYITHIGCTSLCLTHSVILGYSHCPGTDPHGHESDRQQTHNTIPSIPQSVAGLDELAPQIITTLEAGGYMGDHMAGNRTRGNGRPNPTPDDPYAGQHGLNEFMYSRQFQTGCNQGYSQARGTLAHLDDHASPLNDGLHRNGMMHGYRTQVPYMPRHNNPLHGSSTAAYQSPPPRGSNGETANVFWFTGQMSESCRQLDPTTLLSVVPPVAPSSIQYKAIQQTLYECPTQQHRWIRQPPIEFGLVKLTDAVGLGCISLPGYNDKVLDYEGVGSSISCRLNFSSRELGRYKILTTDNKKTPEPITKKKLASEVAKFVKRHIGAIMVQEGCSEVTGENVVLGKLHHVSRASWQPELWHEVTTPDHNSS